MTEEAPSSAQISAFEQRIEERLRDQHIMLSQVPHRLLIPPEALHAPIDAEAFEMVPHLLRPVALHGGPALRDTGDGGVLAVDLLVDRMPWAEPLARAIEPALRLQRLAGRPWLRFDPTLVLGPPGIGKSNAATVLARISGCATEVMSCAGLNDARTLEGNSRNWSNRVPAWPTLVAGRRRTANPVLVLDELDKVSPETRNGNVHQCLLPLLEPSTARCYPDPCLLMPVDLGEVSWLATANSTSTLPRPLLSRLDVVELRAPTLAEVDRLIDDLIASTAQRLEVPSDRLPELPRSTRRQLLQGFERTGSIRLLARQVRWALASLDGEGSMLHH